MRQAVLTSLLCLAMKCVLAHLRVSHSRSLCFSGKHAGICFACIGRMSSGNRRRGIKTRRTALAGIGQVPVQHGLRKHRTSLAVNGVDAFRAKLLHHVHANLPERHTLKLIDKIIRLVLCRRADYVPKVTQPFRRTLCSHTRSHTESRRCVPGTRCERT